MSQHPPHAHDTPEGGALAKAKAGFSAIQTSILTRIIFIACLLVPLWLAVIGVMQ